MIFNIRKDIFNKVRISTPILFLVSDDDEAKELIKIIIKNIGFEPFDLGGMENVLLQEPGGAFYNKALTLTVAEEIWKEL